MLTATLFLVRHVHQRPGLNQLPIENGGSAFRGTDGPIPFRNGPNPASSVDLRGDARSRFSVSSGEWGHHVVVIRPARNTPRGIVGTGSVIEPATERLFDPRPPRSLNERAAMEMLIATNISGLSPNRKIPTKEELKVERLPWTLLITFAKNGDPAGALNSHPPIELRRVLSAPAVKSVLHDARILLHLAVAIEYRRCGVARKLVEAAEAIHRSEDARLWYGLVSPEEEAALHFYRSCGFLTTADAAAIPDASGGIVASIADSQQAGTWIFKTL